MLCRKCSEEFSPTAEEERLILQGDLEPICDKCAPPPRAPPPIYVPTDEKEKTLWRADRTDTEGKIVAFMRTPKVIKRPTISPLVKPRADSLHVFVLSEGDPRHMSAAPRVILHTNIETFFSDKQNLWICKIPSSWDGQTGIARIEVKLEDVADIIKDESRTLVRCQDGSEVRLHYE